MFDLSGLKRKTRPRLGPVASSFNPEVSAIYPFSKALIAPITPWEINSPFPPEGQELGHSGTFFPGSRLFGANRLLF